jgi:carbon monoxide dehydrogenase subunit G
LQLVFKKEYVINSEIEKVWNFLTDIKMVTSCIPHLEDLQIESPTKFAGKTKPPYSFIRGKFKINSEIEIIQEKECLKIIVNGSSIGSSLEITMNVVILPVDGTKIQLDVEVKTFGLLKPIPKSLIYKAVDDIEKLMLSCIKERLEGKSLI